MAVEQINFTPSPTLKELMLDNSSVRGVIGPVGSGKSVGCLMEMVRRAKMQEPGRDKIRRSRYAVVRNTVQQLKDTTLATFFDWFPNGHAGKWMEQEKKFIMRFDDVYIEWLFRALDRPDDAKKLLSLELSGAYINEAREIPFELYTPLRSRLGRYPSMRDVECTFPFLIFDTNPPDEDHWIYSFDEVVKPEGFKLFHQPPAMIKHADGTFTLNPAAENIGNLRARYYEDMIQGATDEFIDVHVLAKYGSSKSGRPVWGMFRKELHVAAGPLRAIPGKVVVIGMDFGLNPAAVFKQQDVWGHVNTIATTHAINMGLKRFVKLQLIPLIKDKFAGQRVRFVIMGDPSGAYKSDTVYEESPLGWLEKKGFTVLEAPTNDLVPRLGATEELMTTFAGDMKPQFQISPECEWLIAALNGKYKYAKKRDGDFEAKPAKNEYSHIADANQYADMFFTYNYDADGALFGDQDERINIPGFEVADSETGY